MATKKCPHCGSEIQSEAKKCRYCKQWIDDAERPQTLNEQQANASSADGTLMEYDKEDKSIEKVNRNHNRKGCIIFVVAFFVFAFFLCPSEREHEQEIKAHLVEFARTVATEKLQDNMKSDLFGLGNLLGAVFTQSDALMETVVNNYVTIDINSYGLFSLGFIGEKDGNEQKLVSIGFMGKVFFLADMEDFKKNIE